MIPDSVSLHKVTFEFSQDGNTNGTTDEIEELDIIIDSPDVIDGDGYFFVIRTTTGWSIDSIEELSAIFETIDKAMEVFT